MLTALSLVLGYLIGSLPTAYLLVQWTSRRDIRSEGTGNVGAMNALEVTKSVPVGLCVLAVDAVKGAGTVWLCALFPGHDFWTGAAGAIACVAGHNYSPWIGFRGGRGLAPAAGAMVVLGWPAVLLWMAFWAASYAWTRHLHVSNVIASAAAPVGLMWLVPERFLEPLVLLEGGSTAALALALAAVSVVILSRHVREMRTLIQSRTQ